MSIRDTRVRRVGHGVSEIWVPCRATMHIHTADRTFWAAASLLDLVVSENTCPCLGTLDQLLFTCLEQDTFSLSAHDCKALGLVTRASHHGMRMPL